MSTRDSNMKTPHKQLVMLSIPDGMQRGLYIANYHP